MVVKRTIYLILFILLLLAPYFYDNVSHASFGFGFIVLLIFPLSILAQFALIFDFVFFFKKNYSRWDQAFFMLGLITIAGHLLYNIYRVG